MSIVRTLYLAASLVASTALAQAPRPETAPPAPIQPGIQAPAAAETPELGRLFFSPAERARLDELRRRPSPPPQSPVAAAQPEAAPPPPLPQYVTLNGVVRRSDGSTTVWLNNKPVRGQKTDDGIVVAPAGRGAMPGNVTVRVPQTGRSVDLKVGQQLEVQSGQVQETYRTQRAAAAAADPATTAAANTTAAEPSAPAPRRSNRERDLLRDLLREIDGPDAGANPGSKPAPSSSAR